MTAYPSDLVEAIKSCLHDEAESPYREPCPPIPRDSVLQMLLETSFGASLLTEEGRRPGFRLIYLSPDALSAKQEYREFTRARTISFTCRRPFIVSEIVRLAPAAKMDRSLICVYDFSSDGSAEDLQIWGLLDVGANWWNFVHHAASSGQPPPIGITITSSKPGELSISSRGRVYVRLSNGTIVVPSHNALWQGDIDSFLAPASQSLYTDTCKLLGVQRFDEDGHDNDYPQRFYVHFLERLLFNVRDRRHGGTVVIVRDELAADDSRLTDRVLLKYACENNHAWSLLVARLANHRRYYDLYVPLADGVDLTVERFSTMHRLESDKDELDEAISDVSDSIASLTAVDGAVLMTDHFRVLGFGAEVVAQSQSLTELTLADDHSKSIPIDSFGTRHRSAFRFCSSYEDSLAFIVSQDGGVKAVKRSAGNVLFWPDINEGMFGL